MDYIDLMDDSDDDIPLITSKPNKQITKSKSTPGCTAFSILNAKEETVVLLSSDEEAPIPKYFKSSHQNVGSSKDADFDSDSTMKYSSDHDSLPDIFIKPELDSACRLETATHQVNSDSNSDKTERYSNSSDFDSLPDIENEPTLTSAALKPSAGSSKTSLQDISSPSTSKHVALKSYESVSNSLDISDKFTIIKDTKMKSTKASVKAAEKERIKREKEIERQKKQEEKEKKLLDKKRDQAMKEAEREARRAAQPGECHRHMLLEVSHHLECTTLGVCIEAACVANNVPMKYVSASLSNTIVFKRQLITPQCDTPSYVQEDNMAVVLQMSDMVDMSLSMLGIGSSHLSLTEYIKKIYKSHQAKVTLIVFGCEKYFRTIKTQKNRVHRDTVCGTQRNSKKNKDMTMITRAQYEEATTALQMATDTVVINMDLEEDVAKTILRLNKAIAEAPVKRGRYETEAMSVKTTGLKIGKDNSGCRQVWSRMLQESRNISADVAMAIVSKWPAPYMLFQEYERLSSSQGELLLQDIEVRRGGGVVQTSRRVGKETSRRIYELFTKNSEFIIK
ncbi:EME1 [Bugula neritina]|uniref:EME1 n=1 Tax=Bugula neritina TaxID=10212 RepID=A0A7J7JWX5_BUGNE|nr:EME1 [Bugula neritina]